MATARTHSSIFERLAVAGLAFVGVVFLVSSYYHLHNPMSFLRSVLEYQVIGGYWAILASAILPLLQVLLGVWLLMGVELKLASVGASALLLMFLLAQCSVAWRGLVIDCGCFGPGSSNVGFQSISLVIVLLVVSISGFAMLATKKSFKQEGV